MRVRETRSLTGENAGSVPVVFEPQRRDRILPGTEGHLGDHPVEKAHPHPGAFDTNPAEMIRRGELPGIGSRAEQPDVAAEHDGAVGDFVRTVRIVSVRVFRAADLDPLAGRFFHPCLAVNELAVRLSGEVEKHLDVVRGIDIIVIEVGVLRARNHYFLASPDNVDSLSYLTTSVIGFFHFHGPETTFTAPVVVVPRLFQTGFREAVFLQLYWDVSCGNVPCCRVLHSTALRKSGVYGGFR